LRLHFCGVRGSTPAPGAGFVRVGGHTSSVALTLDGEQSPRLVLDAGTGLQRVAGLLDGGPFRGTILLTHLHWDHTQGLPFFGAADRPDARTTLVMPGQGDAPEAVFGRVMSPPHFPIGPSELRGDWTFTDIEPGEHDVEGFRVTAFEVPHKGGRTFGYRVAADGTSFAYVPDHVPGPIGPSDPVVRALRGVDVLVHDAQFTAAESALARAYGHSTLDQAVALAHAAEVGTLVLFHHAPGRNDDAVDDGLATARLLADVVGGPAAVHLAVEGRSLEVAGPMAGNVARHPATFG
jgi:ribonuclease BN (tRNA processing enzyme)